MNIWLMFGKQATHCFIFCDVKMINYFVIINRFSINKALRRDLEYFSVLYYFLTNLSVRTKHTCQIKGGRASDLGNNWVRVVG